MKPPRPSAPLVGPLVALLCGLLLAGCAATRPVPVDRFYRLPQPGPAAVGRVFPGTLAIGRVTTGGLYNERAILYVDTDAPLEIRRYRYHLWQDVPASLIQEHLRAYLEAAGVADQVLFMEPGLRPDLLLEARLGRFEQLVDENGSRVAVRLEFTGRPRGGRPWRRQYALTEAVEGEGMEAVVAAFGRALDRIYARLLDDAAAVGDR